jgi:hypothetical protein
MLKRVESIIVQLRVDVFVIGEVLPLQAYSEWIQSQVVVSEMGREQARI